MLPRGRSENIKIANLVVSGEEQVALGHRSVACGDIPILFSDDISACLSCQWYISASSHQPVLAQLRARAAYRGSAPAFTAAVKHEDIFSELGRTVTLSSHGMLAWVASSQGIIGGQALLQDISRHLSEGLG